MRRGLTRSSASVPIPSSRRLQGHRDSDLPTPARRRSGATHPLECTARGWTRTLRARTEREGDESALAHAGRRSEHATASRILVGSPAICSICDQEIPLNDIFTWRNLARWPARVQDQLTYRKWSRGGAKAQGPSRRGVLLPGSRRARISLEKVCEPPAFSSAGRMSPYC